MIELDSQPFLEHGYTPTRSWIDRSPVYPVIGVAYQIYYLAESFHVYREALDSKPVPLDSPFIYNGFTKILI